MSRLDSRRDRGPTGGEVACRARSSRGTALSGFDAKSLPPAFAAREESGVASRVPGTRSRILCWSRPQSNSSKTSKGFLPCCLAVCRMLVSTAWARAPRGVRLPPQFLRAPIRARMARSLTLFVASSPGQWRKVKR